MQLGGRLNQGFAADTAGLLRVFQSVSNLSLPFLLIAVFAQLLNTDEGYSKSVLVNGAATAGICALFYLVFYRYIVGGVATFLVNPSDALPSVSALLSIVAPYVFLLSISLSICSCAP